MKTVCFDIDGVLCTQTDGRYEDAAPNQEMIRLVNDLYSSGVRIVLHTSRYMGRAAGDAVKARELGYEFTRAQLTSWGVRFHELHLGKPRYHVVVDDRSVFFCPDVNLIRQSIEAFLAECFNAS